MCIIESATGQRFFNGQSDVQVLRQVQDFTEETASNLPGPLMRRFRESLCKVQPHLRKSLGHLVKVSPDNRAHCEKFAVQGHVSQQSGLLAVG